MANRVHRAALVYSIAAALAASGSIYPLRLYAQAASQATATEDRLPLYEVASIRLNKSGVQSPYLNTPDGFNVTGGSLIQLIGSAFGFWGIPNFDSDRLFGAPDWAKQAKYDVSAKVGEADIPAFSKLSPDQRRRMLRPILEDRFKLRVHVEQRVFTGYRLIVAKNGAKLQEATPGHVYADKLGGGGTGANRLRSDRGVIVAQGIPLTVLADQLTRSLGRTVVDGTNLTGRYDLSLRFSLDQGATPGPAEVGSAEPSIFTALQEQLGLKLEPAKEPLDVLVIDHIEPPSEN
jgi:uncharacterized protein (TIGR03435 family)